MRKQPIRAILPFMIQRCSRVHVDMSGRDCPYHGLMPPKGRRYQLERLSLVDNHCLARLMDSGCQECSPFSLLSSNLFALALVLKQIRIPPSPELDSVFTKPNQIIFFSLSYSLALKINHNPQLGLFTL